MKVLLVDDHILVRKGIAALLSTRNIEIAGEASSGVEAVEKAASLQPDLVIMDIKMPGKSGLEALREIKSILPKTKIVMLTVSEEDDDLFEAMRSGADGYMLKNLKAEEFFGLLSALEKGEKAITPALASRLISEFVRQPTPAAPEQLTPREIEVLNLVAAGEPNRVIARRLQVSENTIKFHLRNVMDKLQLRNRTQLAAYAINKGIAPSGPGASK
ncbi:MAG: response regulator transcription factor [Chloroflexi bacterium]|nr:response regulator transcription factor [Chloroflexota bacterium]